MSELTITEAFAKYGAVLKQPRCAFSAIAEDGSVVLSCWQHMLKPQPGNVLRYRYEDQFSRWKGNARGKALLLKHLQQAVAGNLLVRSVIAKAEDTAAIDAGKDASKVKKIFHLWKGFVGKVVELTADKFIIDFQKPSPS